MRSMVLLPKNLVSGAAAIGFIKGALVVYEQESRPLLGVITELSKQKHSVLNLRGRVVELNANRLHLVPGNLKSAATAGAKERAEELLAIHEKALEGAKDLKLEEIWTFVADEKQDFTATALCRLYFGNNTLEEHLPLLYALLGDNLYFKRKRDFFTPRSVQAIEELKKAEKAKERKEALQQRLADSLKKRLQDRSTPIEKELEPSLRLLTELAANAQTLSAKDRKEGKALIKFCNDALDLSGRGNLDRDAFQILEKVDYLHRNSNLSLVRYGIKRSFNESLLQAAEAISVPESFASLSKNEKEYRVDLTHLSAVTIDDESTRDMDDALTLEKDDDGFMLGIHISDVASAISADDPLDTEAAARATSIYCPEETVHMFPPLLSEDKLSLVEGGCRRALSCMIKLDSELNVISSELKPSLIKVTARLDYDKVDELLATDKEFPEYPFIYKLYDIACAFEKERLKKGALKIPKRIVYISVDDPDNIAQSDFTVREVDEDSPAHKLISEMMVKCSSVSADFAVSNKIPLFFRGQDAPEQSAASDLTGLPPGPAYDYALRAGLKRSIVSATPGFHATLALEAYAQTTSPIRRYGDLINQRQLSHFLIHQKAYYPINEIEALIDKTAEPLQRAMVAFRDTRRFWLLKYLQRRAKDNAQIMATVIRTDLKSPQVELSEIFMPYVLKTDRDLKRGDVVALKIAGVNPFFDQLRLELI